MQLSAAIIARDEARHIAGCIDSLAGLADEIVVLLDDRTHDETATICASHGACVHREPWRGFPAQRNRALDLCQAPWVLFIDADERVEPDLASEIRQLITTNPSDAGFWIPRHNSFFGQTLRGGGWYPDPQLRLLRRTAARYDEGRLVHEFAELQGTSSTLHGHFTHYNIERFGEFWQKQTSYALAQAHTMAREGRRTRARNFVGAPAREFWRRYVALGGWRDGPLGIFLCASLAWFELVTFAFLLLISSR
ncbi:MAG: glycosyltransferase family 2 protein, partial [Oscillochloris sp.]|nr:glycosyltransferase family 2 protein [Oscillochloris sp.]